MWRTIATIACLSLWGASSTLAQIAPCVERDGLLTLLEQKYGEVPVAVGITGTGPGTNGGALIELLTAKGGMTWTIILTMPNGQTCLIASGEGWRELTPLEGPNV